MSSAFFDANILCILTILGRLDLAEAAEGRYENVIPKQVFCVPFQLFEGRGCSWGSTRGW